MAQRSGTSTSAFGVGRREAHDSTPFYDRFSPPQVSGHDLVTPTDLDELFIHGDARHMGSELPDGSVALVVTSPPYFAGKEYELALGEGHIPASYLDYLSLLEEVFRRCVEKLEPGGRLAVNVANLGRRPYRSLSSDVTRILQDDLGLLLRGEVIWLKGRGQSGSCAWGTFRSASNPVLRDVTERIVIASKGRFDRAGSSAQRAGQQLPHQDTMSNDEFLEATLDVWQIPPESAKRVGHPAPFPVALPQRLVELYTYRDDLVLDPFLGSGSTAVAAVRTGRRCAGYDTDRRYVGLTRERVRAERAGCSRLLLEQGNGAPAGASKAIAAQVVEAAGFHILERERRFSRLGVGVSLVAEDLAGKRWYFDVTGGFTTTRSGLMDPDTLWKCLGRAAVLGAEGVGPLVLVTSHLPLSGSPGDRALRAARPCFDVIEILNEHGRQRLARYAGGVQDRPLPGFWSEADIRARF